MHKITTPDANNDDSVKQISRPAVEAKPSTKPDDYRDPQVRGEFHAFTIPAGPRWPVWAAWNFLASEFAGYMIGAHADLMQPNGRDEFWIKSFAEGEMQPELAFYRGEFYRYEGTHNCYRAVPMEQLRAHVLNFLSRGEMQTAKGKVDIPTGPQAVASVVAAIKAARGVLLDDAHDAPHWRRWPTPPGKKRPRSRFATEPEAANWVAFKDGWIVVDPETGQYEFRSRYNSKGSTVKIARDLFTLNALPYRFAEQASHPDSWMKFLESVWGSADASEAQTLQEFMGLSITRDTTFHKVLLVVGPKRSGKGTIARVWRSMLGESNVATPTAATLTERFGLWGLVDRQLAVISDARFQHGRDSSIVTERLLSISGEDALIVDRKNLPPLINHKLTARLVLMSNEIPRLTDSARALPSRFIAVETPKSFYGREDRSLDKRLRREIPGIILWALEGLQRLYQRGHFIQPASGDRILESMAEHSSEVGVFVDECCERPTGWEGELLDFGKNEAPPNWHEEPARLFRVYVRWCEASENRKPRSKSDFLSQVSALEGVRYERVREDGARPRRVTGLRLRDDCPYARWDGGAD